MYRLSEIDMQGAVFQKISRIISDNLCEMIDMVLGKPDEDGIYSDEARINDFMEHNSFLNILRGKTLVLKSGITMNWWQVIGSRYADIYRKLKDDSIAYTFDEFGMGLIIALMELFSGNYDDFYYLCKYKENHKYFVRSNEIFDYKYAPPLDIDYEKESDNNFANIIYIGFIPEERFSFPIDEDIQDILQGLAEQGWEALMEDGYTDDYLVEVKDPITGEITKQQYKNLFIQCHKLLNSLAIYDRSTYYKTATEQCDGEEEDIAEEFGLEREDTPFVHNFFTPDDDYMLVFEGLMRNQESIDDLDKVWKKTAPQFGFVARSSMDFLTFESDYGEEVSHE